MMKGHETENNPMKMRNKIVTFHPLHILQPPSIHPHHYKTYKISRAMLPEFKDLSLSLSVNIRDILFGFLSFFVPTPNEVLLFYHAFIKMYKDVDQITPYAPLAVGSLAVAGVQFLTLPGMWGPFPPQVVSC